MEKIADNAKIYDRARVYGNAHTTILGLVMGMFIMAVSLIAFKMV